MEKNPLFPPSHPIDPATEKAIEDQVAATLVNLDDDDLITLVCGRDEWTTRPLPARGVPPVWVADGPHGLRKSPRSDTGGYGDQVPATAWPTASALAATWNPDLIREVGVHLGQECRLHQVDVLLGPGVNIKRSPLGGRNFEYFSEDPCLAGTMASAYIQGVQSQGVGTSIKHFAANSQETARMVVDARMDPATLREVYLAAFEQAVAEAAPWTVMAAYNKLNGLDCTANTELLQAILKDEWGFQGVVLSDWVAVYDRIAALHAGLDLDMPGHGSYHPDLLRKALAEGRLRRDSLRESARRVLRLVYTARALQARIPAPASADDLHRRTDSLAEAVAAESFVLLKNNPEILPLDPARVRRVVLVGEFARSPRIQGNGSSEVKPFVQDSLLVALQEALPPGLTLDFAPGYSHDGADHPELLEEALETAKGADLVLVHVGLPHSHESEGVDRRHLEIPESHNRLVEALAAGHTNLAVILTNGSAVRLPWVNRVPAILETWLAGQAGGRATAAVLLGRREPAGRLAETFPLRLEDSPAFPFLPTGNPELNYGEGPLVGYRWYHRRQIPVQFPFGHGLSYSQFRWDKIRSDSTELRATGTEIRLRITNTGRRSGSQVVQVYLEPANIDGSPGHLSLACFRKVSLEPGASVELGLVVEPRHLRRWDSRTGRWVIPRQEVAVHVAASAGDVRQTLRLDWKGGKPRPHGLTENHTLRQFLAHPELKAEVVRLMEPYFGANPHLCDGPWQDFKIWNGFFTDMPLIKYPRLSGGTITLEAVRQTVARMQAIEVV